MCRGVRLGINLARSLRHEIFCDLIRERALLEDKEKERELRERELTSRKDYEGTRATNCVSAVFFSLCIAFDIFIHHARAYVREIESSKTEGYKN